MCTILQMYCKSVTICYAMSNPPPYVNLLQRNLCRWFCALAMEIPESCTKASICSGNRAHCIVFQARCSSCCSVFIWVFFALQLLNLVINFDCIIAIILLPKNHCWSTISRYPSASETYCHAMGRVCVGEAINIPYDLIAYFKSLICQLWAFK